MFMITHFHILSKLFFILSTSRTFPTTTSLFRRLIVPFDKILVELSLENMADPSFYFFNVTNIFLSPIICFEHPLSIYQWIILFWACKKNPHSSTFNSSCFLFQVICCSHISLKETFLVSLEENIKSLLQFLAMCLKFLHL